MSEEEKDKIKEYQIKRYQQLIQYKKEALLNKWVLFLLSIRMSEKTLISVNKKEFHKSKQPIDWGFINIDQVVVSDKFKHSDDCFKYFVGYKEGRIVKPLCSILPQMTGYIKYFVIKDDYVLDKYNGRDTKHKISQHAFLWWKIHKNQSKRI